MLRAPRLVSAGGHAELFRGYPGLRLAVTYEGDPGWLHEGLMLWVIKPDRFAVLNLDGDMHDNMRNSWRTAQIMTGRRRFLDSRGCCRPCRLDGGRRGAPSHH